MEGQGTLRRDLDDTFVLGVEQIVKGDNEFDFCSDIYRSIGMYVYEPRTLALVVLQARLLHFMKKVISPVWSAQS